MGDPIPGPHDFLRKIYDADGSKIEEIEAVIFTLEGWLRDAKRRRDFLRGAKRRGRRERAAITGSTTRR